MEINMSEFPWATAMTVMITLIVTLVGGAVVIWGDPGTLSFEKYVQVLTGLCVANGVLGIGRGIRANGKMHATRRS